MLCGFVLSTDRWGNLFFGRWSDELSLYEKLEDLSQEEVKVKIDNFLNTLKERLSKLHRHELVCAQWYDKTGKDLYSSFENPSSEVKILLEEQEAWEEEQRLKEAEEEAKWTSFIEDLESDCDGVYVGKPYDDFDGFSVGPSSRKGGSTNRERKNGKTLQRVQSGFSPRKRVPKHGTKKTQHRVESDL